MQHIILKIALLWLALPIAGFAQNAKTANKLYDEMGYKLAIPEYEKLEKLGLEELVRVANSHRLNGDTENAEIWYSQVVQSSSEPAHFLYYAQALQSNGKLKEARSNYLLYHEMLGGEASDKRGQLLAEAIDRMDQLKQSGVVVKNEKKINSERLDFSPAYTKDGIVFVSSRGAGAGSLKDKWMNDHFMDLYFAEKKDNGEMADPAPYSNELLTKFHEGPVVFANNDQKIFFTRNQFLNGKRKNNSKGVMKQNIYMAVKEGGTWSEPVELPFNTTEYEEVHPAISPDGQTLFFSSDRPGGFGQMDLYMVKWQAGKWGPPVNLGPEINTPGNDLFPFVHDDGTLYFASEGWGGLGGLDVFSSYLVGENAWVKAQNVGTPFNSPKDDFGLILNTSGTEGFFTSARDGGAGGDDIYSFSMGAPIAQEKKLPVNICVFDAETNERLAGARVQVAEMREGMDQASLDPELIMRLVETENKNEYILKLRQDLDRHADGTIPTYTTGENGEFALELKPGATYRFTAEKRGFLVAETTWTAEQGAGLPAHCIPMNAANCLVLEGMVLNGKFPEKTLPNATVTMINLCTGEEATIRSGANGVFHFPCIDCGCEYILKGEKTNFKSGVADVNTIGQDCDSGGVIETELLLLPADRNELIFAGQRLSVGSAVELRNIFYNFDQHHIRSDARPDLDHVVELMHEFPGLLIELGSHTDARGSHEYNQRLSQNRANAAVDYIVNRGIEKRRIVARGYGESQPRNHCHDGIWCSEEDHQFNRRTEIKVLATNGEKLDIRYIDNPPGYIDRARF